MLLVAAVFASVQAASAANRPASYAEFDTSIARSDGRALKRAIESGAQSYIFVRQGLYVLDNPVLIDRESSLFLHGGNRVHTVLVAKNPALPLFIVKRAPIVNFAGLRLVPTRDASRSVDARAISTVNQEPLVFELLDSDVGQAMLAFEGPGTYHIQTPGLSPGGRVRASIWVDHPDADLFVFGGDGSNGGEALRARSDDFAFVWQKRGRVRVHSTTFEGNLGQGDVRLESASKLGPHVIANVRSEGVNGALAHTGASSRLLYVPPTTEKVDVLLKNNGGAWNTGPRSGGKPGFNCHMISYNGAGTVWLLGNRAEGSCGLHIGVGRAPEATIVSVGNLISGSKPFTITAKRIISASDLFNHAHWKGDQTNPAVRWIPDGSPAPKLSSYADVPPVPDETLPRALMRPRLTSALPDMIDVKGGHYGAKGDGTTDDTRRIQKALDAQCDGQTPKTIFFPEGTYRITDTLYLYHHSGGSCRRPPAGGWIAGAGSSRTILAMDPGVKKGTFATDGLVYATVQGITFKTWAWRAGDPEVPNIDVEFYPGYRATQQNNFYDVVADGGFGGLAFGVKHPTGAQCSSNVLFGGEIKNTHIGLISGHYNALANGVVATRLIDNDYALGSWTDLSNQGKPPQMPAGGTFFAYDSVSRGTRIQDFLFAGSANGSTWYFHDYSSDAPRYFVSKPTAAHWPIMFDRARLEPRAGAEYLFDVASSMGPIFLHSSLTRSAIRIGQTSMGQSYAIKLHSTIPDWAAAVTSPHGQTDSLD